MYNKIKIGINSVCWIFLCYIIGILSIRLVDCLALPSNVPNLGICLIYSLLHSILSCGVFLGVVFVIHVPLHCFFGRIIDVFTSALMGLMLIVEVALDVFASKSGALLGVEIILRPIAEMTNTIMASVGNYIWLYLLLFVLFLCVFTYLSMYMSRKVVHNNVMVVCLLYIVCSCFTMPGLVSLERKTDRPNVQNFITNKTFYLARACMKYIFSSKYSAAELNLKFQSIVIDSVDLQTYISNFSDRSIQNIYYPLERGIYDVKDVLSPYFADTNVMPNVVYIVMESLGREWSGTTDLGVSYTPFIDSLARTGLYWRNCLSTTKRSFGAVPSLTGSLPHGPKGFQFGNMPDHNSIISILKSSGYQTNAFYASDFAFDCLKEYLLIEHVDYMSTEFKQECFDRPGKTWGTYWGYHDEFMFSRSLEVLSSELEKPKFNLYVTISAHDDLTERNPHYDSIMQRTENIISKLPADKQQLQLSRIKRIASIVYSDYALECFFDEYCQHDDFKNTIFVVTGDHSAELDSKNRLGFYHVPLIIWSPLLVKNAEFPAVVSHLDVTPSIVSLLHDKYKVPVPDTVAWVGDGLDCSDTFRSRSKFLFMDYSHDIGELIYDNYFYFKEKDALYELDSCLNFRLVSDPEARNEMISQLDVFDNVNNYIYLNDKLLHNSIYSKSGYKNVFVDTLCQMICNAQPQCPSKMKSKSYFLFKDRQIVNTDKSERLRLAISADICIEGDLWKDKQMKLTFECVGNKKQVFSEHITYFITDDIESGKWCKLLISKEFEIADETLPYVSVYIQTPTEDWRYTENNKLTLKNIELYVDKK